MSLEQEYVGSVGAVTYSGTVGYGGEPPTWDEVLDKPSTFTPSAHRHNLSDINNIDSKQDNIIAGRNIYISSDGKTINSLDASSAAAGETTWSNVLGKPDTFTPSAHTHTVSDVTDMPIVCNPNLLDNWYFSDPVNTRGKSSYSSGYTIDRWWLNTSKMSVDISDNGLHLTTASDNSGAAMFLYTISQDCIKSIDGQTVTLSVMASGHTGANNFNLTDVNGFAATHRDVSFADGLVSWTFTAQDVSNGMIAIWCNGSSCGIYIKAVKLEIGIQQTLAHLDNGTWVLNEIPDKVEETTKLLYKNDDGSIKMPFVNPNLLDNWYFAKPVNQRGESSYSGNVWTIDRWLITAPSSTLTVNSGYITYGGQTYSNLGQIVCNNGLAGYPVTFSILHKNAVNVFLSVRKSDWTVIARKQMGSGSNYTLSTVTATVPSGYTDTLILSIAATDESIAQSVDILAAKLEVGTQQTLAHLENGTWVLNEIPDYGEQIARCQRYFYRYPAGFALAVSTGTGRRGNAILPQTMVAVPSVSHPSVIGGTVNNKLVYTDHILFHGVADSDTTYVWLDGWTATVAGLGG